MSPANVLLVSTYELGHQPFGLASPARWLRDMGATVRCVDLAVDHLDDAWVREADLVACYVPMHTATRLAASVARRVVAVKPGAQLCFYGLYAPMNEGYLRQLGAQTILGGEFEEGLATLVRRLGNAPAGQPGAGNGQPAGEPSAPGPATGSASPWCPWPGSSSWCRTGLICRI